MVGERASPRASGSDTPRLTTSPAATVKRKCAFRRRMRLPRRLSDSLARIVRCVRALLWILLALAFAVFIAAHVALVVGILRANNPPRAALAFLVPPLAPFS